MPIKSNYAWRKEHHLCVLCGTRSPEKGKLFCWSCKMAHRDKRGVEYIHRVDNGLCGSCGKPLDRNGAICEACRLKRKEANVARVARLKEAGLCPICGKRPMYEGLSCALCRDKKQRVESARKERRAA